MKMYAHQVEAALNGYSEERKQACIEDLQIEFVPPSDRGSLEQKLQVCPSCGRLDWVGSKTANEESFVLDYQKHAWRNEIRYCEDCNDMAQRNPELVILMGRMIAHALHMQKKETE